jgi:predicted adenylyl cyclase CyaB
VAAELPSPGAARNVEIKARVSDLAALRHRAEAAGAVRTAELRQRDTFFPCAEGRLKLRDFGDGRGELIRYARPDAAGPKTSSYRLVPTADPENLRAALSEALGVLVEVRKHRELWMAGRTRIHLDRVEGLGDFLELEVVLAPGEALSEGEAEAHELMRDLAVSPEDLVAGAYADLIVRATQS